MVYIYEDERMCQIPAEDDCSEGSSATDQLNVNVYYLEMIVASGSLPEVGSHLPPFLHPIPTGPKPWRSWPSKVEVGAGAFLPLYLRSRQLALRILFPRDLRLSTGKEDPLEWDLGTLHPPLSLFWWAGFHEATITSSAKGGVKLFPGEASASQPLVMCHRRGWSLLASEGRGWISGPTSIPHITHHSKIQLSCQPRDRQKLQQCRMMSCRNCWKAKCPSRVVPKAFTMTKQRSSNPATHLPHKIIIIAQRACIMEWKAVSFLFQVGNKTYQKYRGALHAIHIWWDYSIIGGGGFGRWHVWKYQIFWVMFSCFIFEYFYCIISVNRFILQWYWMLIINAFVSAKTLVAFYWKTL